MKILHYDESIHISEVESLKEAYRVDFISNTIRDIHLDLLDSVEVADREFIVKLLETHRCNHHITTEQYRGSKGQLRSGTREGVQCVCKFMNRLYKRLYTTNFYELMYTVHQQHCDYAREALSRECELAAYRHR